MSSYSNDQLSTMIDALTARLNAVDGQNLATGVQGTVATAQAGVNGVQQDLRNAITTLEQLIAQLKTDIASYQASAQSLLSHTSS